MITSINNKKIKEAASLIAARKKRDSLKLFTLEGLKLFLETPKPLIEHVFVSSSFESDNQGLLSDIAYDSVDNSIFMRICDTKTPQGILTIARQPKYTRKDILGTGAPFVIVLEDLQDPGNIGTIVRTAEGAGATGIVLSKGCADVFSPKAIRSTSGSVFRVPFIYEENLIDIVCWLSENNVHTYGAHLKASCNYFEPLYDGGTALFIGNESSGLSLVLSKRLDTLIKIPMRGRLESLNAAVAASVLMYAVSQKRGNAG